MDTKTAPILIKVIFDYIFYKNNFREQFPMDALESKNPGALRGEWEISYIFDSLNGREHLDCFAYHPVSEYSIIRIYDDGTHDIAGIQEMDEGFLQFVELLGTDRQFEDVFEMAGFLGLDHTPLPHLTPRQQDN